jgi:cytidine deaminase
MAEFGLDTIVLLADFEGNLLREMSVAELLPEAFRPNDLKR